MEFSFIRARIEYRAASEGRSRGCEWMSISRYPDGEAVYRAHSENADKGLTRDVLMRLDARWRPLECFFALRRERRHAGSMRYRFGAGYAEADGWNVETGPVRLRFEIDGTPRGFCPHPVSSDALLVAAFDRAAPERVQSPPSLFMSSTDPFGGTGPTLHPIVQPIEYLGGGTLDTPIGSLPTDRYCLPIGTDGSLVSILTCLAGTPVFLRAEIGGSAYPTIFELSELELV
jgi:hypothetical protein